MGACGCDLHLQFLPIWNTDDKSSWKYVTTCVLIKKKKRINKIRSGFMLFMKCFLNRSAELEVLLVFARIIISTHNKQITWFFLLYSAECCFYTFWLHLNARFVFGIFLRRLYFKSWVFQIIICTCLLQLRNFLNEYWLKSRCLCGINDCFNQTLNSAQRCWLACKRESIISISNHITLVETNELKWNRNDLIIGFSLPLSHQSNSGFLARCTVSMSWM